MRDPTDYHPDYVESGGDAVDGTVVFTNFTPFEEASQNKETALYLSWLQQVRPGADPTFFGVFAWSAARLFVEKSHRARRRAQPGGADRRRSRRPTKWTGNGIHAPQNVGTKHTGDCWRFIQLNDGKWSAVGGTKYQCAGVDGRLREIVDDIAYAATSLVAVVAAGMPHADRVRLPARARATSPRPAAARATPRAAPRPATCRATRASLTRQASAVAPRGPPPAPRGGTTGSTRHDRRDRRRPTVVAARAAATRATATNAADGGGTRRPAATGSRTRPASPTTRSPSPTSRTSPARCPASSSPPSRRPARTRRTSTPPTTSAAASSRCRCSTPAPTRRPTSRPTPRPATRRSPRSARCRRSTPAVPATAEGCGLPDIRSTTINPERTRLLHLLRAPVGQPGPGHRASCRRTSSEKYKERHPARRRCSTSTPVRRRPTPACFRDAWEKAGWNDRRLRGHRRLGVQLRALRPADEGRGRRAGRPTSGPYQNTVKLQQAMQQQGFDPRCSSRTPRSTTPATSSRPASLGDGTFVYSTTDAVRRHQEQGDGALPVLARPGEPRRGPQLLRPLRLVGGPAVRRAGRRSSAASSTARALVDALARRQGLDRQRPARPAAGRRQARPSTARRSSSSTAASGAGSPGNDYICGPLID